jgi:cytochrome c oxidase subunit 2
VGGDTTRGAFDALFSAYFVVTTAAVLLVLVALAAAVLRGRRRGARRGGDPSRLEIGYVLLLSTIAVALMAVTVTTELNVDARRPAGVQVQVVASQWRWTFQTEQAGHRATTFNRLVVPRGTTIAFHIRSRDVIHSMWIPEVRFKRYAFPDRTTTYDLEFPSTGTFEGLCAQFCGLDHDRMRFTVQVVDAAGFAAWLEAHAS